MVALVAADSVYIWMVSVVAADSLYIWMVAVIAADSFYIWMVVVVAADSFYIWMVAVDAADSFYIWTRVSADGMLFLPLIRHPPCYSYIQSSPAKVLAVIEKRKYLRKK